MTNLQSQVLTSLSLDDPLMIASSHWTSTDTAFRQLASVRPAAITLKTTSQKTGGDGQPGKGKARKKLRLRNPFGSAFAYYTDGPKDLEHWNLEATVRMTGAAREQLPGAAIGLSILAGEDYGLMKESLQTESYRYVELNWKYTFRDTQVDPEKLFEDVRTDVEAFFDTFAPLPVLVKLSRESLQHLRTEGFQRVLALIEERGGGLIVANTLKARVPPSRVPQHDPAELNQGVIFGEHLFLDTYNALRDISEAGMPAPPLIASGGIIDIGSVVDAFAAGAEAVQLCSALDLRTVRVVETLREELSALVAPYGSFANFVSTLREDAETQADLAVKARGFELDERRVIHGTLADRSRIDDLVARALAVECAAEGANVEPKEHGPLDKEYRFVVTYGNVSAYFLANACAQRLRFSPLDMENMSAFRAALAQPEFEYDFAIIPEASLRAIQRTGEKVLGPLYPDECGQVAVSMMELVGDSTLQPEQIAAIYHFGGSSALETVKSLEKEFASPMQELTIADCFPLFKFWKQEHAILAKPPLSRFYGLFVPTEIAKLWGVLWQRSEPLLLVASRRTLADEAGKQAVQVVLETMEAERRAVLERTDEAVRTVVQSGFVRYCAKLLGSKAEFG